MTKPVASTKIGAFGSAVGAKMKCATAECIACGGHACSELFANSRQKSSPRKSSVTALIVPP